MVAAGFAVVVVVFAAGFVVVVVEWGDVLAVRRVLGGLVPSREGGVTSASQRLGWSTRAGRSGR